MIKLIEELSEIASPFRLFAAEHVTPYADLIDREEYIPIELINSLAHAGLLASGLPLAYGGSIGVGPDHIREEIRHGLMHEALGGASASVQGLVNVHHMAGSSIARWGNRDQKQQWLPRLATGDLLAAIAITEPNIGSDASAVETIATKDGPDYIISGVKDWITCGQIADLFVLLTRSEAGPLAFLMPSSTEGLTIQPIRGMIGCRGYQLARLLLDRCKLSADNVLGRAGFGLSHVAATGLDSGRYNLAWGCVGLAEACLTAAFKYARERRQFQEAIGNFQLVQRQISRMMTDVHAARLMCIHSGELRGRRNPAAVKESTMAKYFASTMVNRVANDALQIHGARGASQDYPLARYFRDARIMEIIEGTTQILEISIARYGFLERS